MDYSKEKVVNYFLYDTQVENLFAAEYMLDAPGDYVKVYLLALAHAQMGNPVDELFLAKQLRLSVEQVENAWDYWEAKSVVRKIWKDKEHNSYEMKFVNLKEAVFASCAVDYSPKSAPKAVAALDDKQLAALYADVESVTGRLLEGKEPETIAVWLTEFSMAPDFILAGYKYCTERGKSNRCKYVEKVLLDWREKELSSAAMVEEYLRENDRQYEIYKQVFKRLGFRRNPTDPEKTIMNKWFTEMNFSPEEVFAAIEKTTGISNPNIKYLDSVLCSRFNEKKQEDSDRRYARIEQLYAKTREANEKQYAKIKSEIFEKLPRVEQISLELKDSGLRIVRAMLSIGSEDVLQIQEKQEKLRAEQKSLLLSAGYKEDALEPIYTCKKCKDTGLLDDGSYCSCYAEKLNAVR